MSPETFMCEPEDHKIELIGIDSMVDPVRLMTDCVNCHMVPGYRYVSLAKIWEWLEEDAGQREHCKTYHMRHAHEPDKRWCCQENRCYHGIEENQCTNMTT